MLPISSDTLSNRVNQGESWHQSRREDRNYSISRANSRRYILNSSHKVKVVGFNYLNDQSAATTGTSKPETLCLTDGMAACIAVAIGGEGAGKAKVRIFHIYEDNINVENDLVDYIEKLQNSGMNVTAAMHGGLKNSGEMNDNQELAISLRKLFSEMNVEMEFDETCELREDFNPLGVVIRDDNTVQFVTELDQEMDESKDDSDEEFDESYRSD